MKSMKAFTLVEMIIVIVIFSILVVIVTPVLQTGFSAYNTARDLSNSDAQSNLALERMVRDIRDIPTTAGISIMNSNQFTFIDATKTTVTYNLSGTDLMRNNQMLATGVNTLTFAYYDSLGAVTASASSIRYVTISLNITLNNTNTTVFTSINLRNIK